MMAKRELITKEDALMALTGCFELGVTLDKYSASCQKHIEAIKPITEQEIVKPYLDKLKVKIEALSEGLRPLVHDDKWENTIKEGEEIAFDAVIELIDNLGEQHE
jgi:hypothetical protein